MKLSEILRDIEIISATADMDTEIGGVSYDSRRTEPGDLFVAVKGFSSDGHRFIPTAMEKGAAAVLCEDAPTDGTPYVRVADCRRGLALPGSRPTGATSRPARAFCVREGLQAVQGL